MYSSYYNLAVGGKSKMVHIPYVKFKLPLPGDRIAAVALRPAGYSGAHFVTSGLLWGIKREILHQQRSGTDEAHVALEDVPQLWQFVEGGRAYETADFCQAVRIGQKPSLRVAFVGHGLELDHMEYSAVFTGAFLSEESSRSLVGEMQPQGNSKEDRGETKEGGSGNENVEGAFEVSSIHWEVSVGKSLLGNGGRRSVRSGRR